ncbi:MAG: ABC transporter permease [Gemmatimonadales bacterium]|uniref:ABC transporter permease n=1 Tax=Candidatus Palauibacter irciniicola TaxID=3056733 RepID=UPI00137D8820|nr:ABC transporter permease [Candidatus Palauibacter irciniicola]MYC17357.1 ABC transporter permease [Gemmatimonadales bacterium]
MLVLDLALKSLRNRAFSTSLTVGSIALSFALLIGVENVRVGMRESFSNTISQTDLIVGTKGGTIQLLLYSVFGMGAPTENVSWEAYREWAEHPAVEWTIPYSLGDSHRGFRVVGTNEDFYRHYRYRGGQEIALAEGRPNADLFDVTLGADVAAELNYALGDEVSVTHGLGELGFITHDHMPFTVVGILDKTFTPVDRAIYVTLEGMEAIHWEDGAPPASDDEHDHAHDEEAEAAHDEDDHAHDEDDDDGHDEDDHAHDDEAEAAPADDGHAHDQEVEAAAADDGHAHAEDISIEDVEISQVTSFFVGTTDRRDVLQLQRDINDFEDEPMMAVLPGVALNEMWQGLGYAETGLRLVAIFVVLVGLLGMLVSLYTSLNERRREMAILRAVGAGPNRILALLVLESVCLAGAGALAGLALVYGLLAAGQSIVEAQVGLFIPIRPPGPIELLLLGAVVTAGFLMGFVPAFKAYRTALHDGLAVRV